MIRSVSLEAPDTFGQGLADRLRKVFHEEAIQYWPSSHYSKPYEEFGKHLFGKFALSVELDLQASKASDHFVYALHFDGYIDDKDAESLMGLLYSSPKISLERSFWVGTSKRILTFTVGTPPALCLTEKHDGNVLHVQFTLREGVCA